MKWLKTVLQIAFLIIITILMNTVTHLLHLPIPGSILGIIVLFILLKTKILPLKWIESGASFLLAELLLFFIPSAVGVVNYKQLLIHSGLQVIALVIVSTGLVMAGAGLVVSIIASRKERKSLS
ncbi:CidA/LrgA family holin-like protein [Pullulanibacillus sp. KACC 23026]|uniref:CidA/LrgA family holin-like protein n=1 Tax=Pullulanibacillus sp. KACC 23026 TaxID=3028315 RepID=UPI0023B0768F|nr:CidA/LrgA family holin-like protein [Pullulanibacillus sp. KACC 23026]WEG14758.1 CidA/LrgA family holin-like protein [Pullulanibacillus sp. KACC 23026]